MPEFLSAAPLQAAQGNDGFAMLCARAHYVPDRPFLRTRLRAST